MTAAGCEGQPPHRTHALWSKTVHQMASRQHKGVRAQGGVFALADPSRGGGCAGSLMMLGVLQSHID